MKIVIRQHTQAPVSRYALALFLKLRTFSFRASSSFTLYQTTFSTVIKLFLCSHSGYHIKMHIVNFIPVISLLTAVCSAVPHSHPQAARRDVSTDVTLYAYGTNISGIPIVYGNSDGIVPFLQAPHNFPQSQFIP
jgi:hypothetical protein